jgi:hypothetical protein
LTGLLLTTCGGILSAGPPVGAPTLAQVAKKMRKPAPSTKYKMEILNFTKADNLSNYKLKTFMITEYCKPLQNKL